MRGQSNYERADKQNERYSSSKTVRDTATGLYRKNSAVVTVICDCLRLERRELMPMCEVGIVKFQIGIKDRHIAPLILLGALPGKNAGNAE